MHYALRWAMRIQWWIRYRSFPPLFDCRFHVLNTLSMLNTLTWSRTSHESEEKGETEAMEVMIWVLAPKMSATRNLISTVPIPSSIQTSISLYMQGNLIQWLGCRMEGSPNINCLQVHSSTWVTVSSISIWSGISKMKWDYETQGLANSYREMERMGRGQYCPPHTS